MKYCKTKNKYILLKFQLLKTENELKLAKHTLKQLKTKQKWKSN